MGGGLLRIGAVEVLSQQVLLHLERSRRLVVKPEDVYYLEAAGDDTIVRRRGRQTLRDVRTLGQMMVVLERLRFHRIHDKFAVNLHRIGGDPTATRWRGLGGRAALAGQPCAAGEPQAFAKPLAPVW